MANVSCRREHRRCETEQDAGEHRQPETHHQHDGREANVVELLEPVRTQRDDRVETPVGHEQT
jgi:hypothetical protein